MAEIGDLPGFIAQYWNLTQKPAPLVDLNLVNRAIWYCNLSQFQIPELQEFNAAAMCPVQITYAGDEEKELAVSDEDERRGRLEAVMAPAMQLYTQNVEYRTYHVYGCGHCFLDIAVLTALYNLIKSQYHHIIELRRRGAPAIDRYVCEQLDRMFSGCPMCTQPNSTSPPASNYYDSMNDNLRPYATIDVGGTFLFMDRVTAWNIVPIQYWGYLEVVVRVGQVIDTSGYRGTNMYLRTGSNHYTKVRTIDYYPVWPQEYLDRFGYHYYLNQCGYEELPFKNGLSAIDNGNGRVLFIKEGTLVEAFQAAYEKDPENQPDLPQVTVAPVGDTSTMLLTVGDITIQVQRLPNCSYYQMPYPFTSAEQANTLLASGLELRASLNDHEELIFRKCKVIIRAHNGYSYQLNCEDEDADVCRIFAKLPESSASTTTSPTPKIALKLKSASLPPTSLPK